MKFSRPIMFSVLAIANAIFYNKYGTFHEKQNYIDYLIDKAYISGYHHVYRSHY